MLYRQLVKIYDIYKNKKWGGGEGVANPASPK